MTEWVTEWLSDWVTKRLIDWVTEWLSRNIWIFKYSNIWVLNNYLYLNYYIFDIRIYSNISLQIKIYLKMYFFVSFHFPQTFQLLIAYFPCFSLWSQNVFKYFFKLGPWIYLNICSSSFQSFEFIRIFVHFFFIYIFEYSFKPFKKKCSSLVSYRFWTKGLHKSWLPESMHRMNQ